METFETMVWPVCRLVLGGVLVTAGYLGLNLSQAKMAVRAYEMFPIPVANILAWHCHGWK